MVPPHEDGDDSPEAAILKRIMLALGSRPGTRLFRNTVGLAWAGKLLKRTADVLTLRFPRAIRHGLAPGSSDLIGWQTIEIGPRDVGRRVAVFLAVEVKAAQGTLEPEQTAFIAAVTRAGGIAICARSEDEAKAFLREALDAPAAEAQTPFP